MTIEALAQMVEVAADARLSAERAAKAAADLHERLACQFDALMRNQKPEVQHQWRHLYREKAAVPDFLVETPTVPGSPKPPLPPERPKHQLCPRCEQRLVRYKNNLICMTDGCQ